MTFSSMANYVIACTPLAISLTCSVVLVREFYTEDVEAKENDLKVAKHALRHFSQDNVSEKCICPTLLLEHRDREDLRPRLEDRIRSCEDDLHRTSFFSFLRSTTRINTHEMDTSFATWRLEKFIQENTCEQKDGTE